MAYRSNRVIEKAIKTADVAVLTEAASELLILRRQYASLSAAADDVATSFMFEGLASLCGAEQANTRRSLAEKLARMLHRVSV